MNMHWIDWTIVAGFMLILTVVAIVAKRYNKSVADFLVVYVVLLNGTKRLFS